MVSHTLIFFTRYFRRSFAVECKYFSPVLFLSFICLFRILSCVADLNDSTVLPLEINYLSNISAFNDTLDFINESDININFVNNVSGINESYNDVATELDSTMSVTEDALYSQPYFLFLIPDEDICNCDLTFDVCNINCCCDPDCNEEDSQIFSECSHQALIPDENYCYQKNIILKNSTIYKMVQNPKNSMFCIVHDNLKYHLRYKDMPVLKSHRDLSSVLKYKYQNMYSWESKSDDKQYLPEIKARSPVFINILGENSNIKWTLPSSCLSDVCSCHENILYLKDFESSCSYAVNLDQDCGVNKTLTAEKFLNFCLSHQYAVNFAGDNIVNLIIHSKSTASNRSDYFSENISDLCINTKALKQEKELGLCRNVVTGVDFSIEHNGINGISRITANLHYSDLDISVKRVAQRYRVKFLWSNTSDAEQKSGNPGYQVGLPILVAVNVSDLSSEEQFSKRDYLSVFGRDINSYCALQRVPVNFGKNLNYGCFLRNNFTNCDHLHNKIIDILLGPNKKDIFVGVFGNANISNLNDWIEVFYEDVSILETNSCFVSLNVKLDIVYAAVGSTANPQFKIVGVNYRFAKPEFVDLSCSPRCNNIALATTVAFVDVTLPAVYKYAKVPSIKINLPSDFFYPFMYGHSRLVLSNRYFIFIMFALISFL